MQVSQGDVNCESREKALVQAKERLYNKKSTISNASKLPMYYVVIHARAHVPFRVDFYVDILL